MVKHLMYCLLPKATEHSVQEQLIVHYTLNPPRHQSSTNRDIVSRHRSKIAVPHMLGRPSAHMSFQRAGSSAERSETIYTKFPKCPKWVSIDDKCFLLLCSLAFWFGNFSNDVKRGVHPRSHSRRSGRNELLKVNVMTILKNKLETSHGRHMQQQMGNNPPLQ